jgi:CBS domain-containing protein
MLASRHEVMPAHQSLHAAKRPRISNLVIADVMTPQPMTIGRNQTLGVAHREMREHGIRHLPVLEHGELVGVLSQRDLYFLESIAGADLDKDPVDDAMTQDAFAVGPEVPLEQVAATMEERKLGCAVVVERDRVIGIFTATDALRVLAHGSSHRPRSSPKDP